MSHLDDIFAEIARQRSRSFYSPPTPAKPPATLSVRPKPKRKRGTRGSGITKKLAKAEQRETT